jgi:hypothetical protein
MRADGGGVVAVVVGRKEKCEKLEGPRVFIPCGRQWMSGALWHTWETSRTYVTVAPT